MELLSVGLVFVLSVAGLILFVTLFRLCVRAYFDEKKLYLKEMLYLGTHGDAASRREHDE
jgi:hypothetical protein